MSTRIEYAADQPPSFLARWASRIAVFCVLLLVATAFLHRVFALPTPVALNMAVTAFAGAGLALLMAVIAALDVWVTGRQGAARVVTALAISLGLLALPAALLMIGRDSPNITDVTTDTEHPPEFAAVLETRPADANSLDYGGESVAALQKTSYPDVKPLTVPRGADDAFEVVLQALGKLKLKPLKETPPAEAEDGVGTIELSDKTLVLGFKDDVSIRVIGDETTSEIDVRSASRYGRNDFGRNAERVRAILKEIVGRLEATVPNAERRRAPKAVTKKSQLKRPAPVTRPAPGGQQKSAPSRQKTRRGQEQSE